MMKTFLAMIAVAAVVAWSGCANTAANSSASGPHGQVVVNFDHPDRYTDVKTAANSGTDPYVLEQLKEFLINTASPRVAVGQTLTITFTDIDLAGDLEPWRIRTHDVRIMKDIYPPRAAFTWTLQDQSGAVIRQGDEHISDTSYLLHTNITQDSLFYDKQMLQDWVNRALPVVR